MIPRSSAGDAERRPTALLLVYTWDLLRAILALFGAVAAFGDVSIGNRIVHVSTVAQVLTALAAASLAAALFVVGTLLPRHAAWVRRAQVVVMVMDIAMIWGSVLVYEVAARGGIDTTPLFGAAIFSLIDLSALFAMTGPRVRAWFTEPGPVPLYLGGLIAFWAATSAAFVLLRSF
ncbi:MAG: hypothetical protein E6I76_01890 [Chloroflexi bacterium]|nr:MAG: hypothetical protein E6J03_03725 [Chloroflexota bacterium]TMD99686.1 MAG: hypothetical protein E6I76_01890 [Chloroflexota bacterium]